jgi:hypothetical protein
MHVVRGALEWLGVWIAVSAAVFAALALWMYASFQGVDYRGAATYGAAVGLIAAIVYWALGARTVHGRAVRLLIAGAGLLLLYAVFLGLYWPPPGHGGPPI